MQADEPSCTPDSAAFSIGADRREPCKAQPKGHGIDSLTGTLERMLDCGAFSVPQWASTTQTIFSLTLLMALEKPCTKYDDAMFQAAPKRQGHDRS